MPIEDEIAEMIADTFGRSVIAADRDLARRIITRLRPATVPNAPAGSAWGAPDWRGEDD